MTKMEPAFDGHSRAVCILALQRSIAAMLGPAAPETRARYLAEMPAAIAEILAEIDRMVEEQAEAFAVFNAKKKTPPTR